MPQKDTPVPIWVIKPRWRKWSGSGSRTATLACGRAGLRRVFEQATAAFQEKEAEIRRLKEEAEVLRRKLRDQLQQPFTKSTDVEETAPNQEQAPAGQADQKERKKRGAPKGHRGATRKNPGRAPDRTVLVNPTQCPECHSGNVSACQETEEHTQEDLVIIRPLTLRKQG